MTVRIESRRGRIVVDIRTRGPDGASVRERRNAPDGVRTVAAAKRWAEARQVHLAGHGADEPEAVPAPTFDAFADRWLRDYVKAEKLKPSTEDAYERILRLHLRPVLGPLRLDAIGEMEIQRVKLRMAAAADKTRACALSTLANVLGAAVRWDEIAKAPRIEVPRWQNKEMAFYDFAQWEQLVDGARRAGPVHLVTVLLGGEAGLRRGEMVALEQTDCTPAGIIVQRNEWQGKVGKPKGGKSRRVPMTDRLREATAAVRHLRGKRLLMGATPTTLQSWLETACRRAGLPPSRNLHRLRHTFCSHLAMRGATPRAIQELAGHADLKTTQRYMHLSPAHLEDAIALLAHGVMGAGREQGSAKRPN